MEVFEVMAKKGIDKVNFINDFGAAQVTVEPKEIELLAPEQCSFIKEALTKRGGGHEKLTLKLINGARVSKAIYDSLLGFPLGGTRWRPDYESEQKAIVDNLDLAEGMCPKGWWSGTGTSGSKIVIWSDLKNKTEEFLEAFGEFLEGEADSITGEDMNMKKEDILVIRRKTKKYVVGEIDPSPYTALGVFTCACRMLKDIYGITSLGGIPVAIDGVTGGVGSNLAEFLVNAGAIVTGSYHTNKEKADELVARLGIKIVHDEEIFYGKYLVLSLNSIGKRLNARTIPYIEPGVIICGGANNQLDDPRDYWGDALWKKKRCWYGPDLVVNFGGLFSVNDERKGGGRVEARVINEIRRIAETNIAWIIQRAKIENTSPHRIADMLPRAAIREARQRKYEIK